MSGHGSVLGTTKIVDNGADRKRWNLVILGDGFLASEIGAYRKHVAAFWAAFSATPPFDDYVSAINVYRVDIASDERGAKAWPNDAHPRTYLGATFNTDWNGEPLDRLLTVDDGLARFTAREQAPKYHQILVLVQSNIYGGSGRRPVAVCSTNPRAREIAIHEIGHCFDLADEYAYGRGDEASGPEPSQPNVTRRRDARNKWDDLIKPGTHLAYTAGAPPPPPTVAPPVSTYEGAKYFKRGIYRPYPGCYMNEFDPFCPVCTREIETRLDAYMP